LIDLKIVSVHLGATELVCCSHESEALERPGCVSSGTISWQWK